MAEFKVHHNTNREDLLAPKNFDPANVEVVAFLDTTPPHAAIDPMIWALVTDPDQRAALMAEMKALEDAWKARNREWFDRDFPPKQCGHCGAHIRWAYVVKWLPTGEFFVTGEICGDERMTLPNRAAFDKRAEKMRAQALKVRLENIKAKAKFYEDHKAEVEFLDKYDGDSDFFLSLQSQLNSRGELSDRQLEFVTKEITRSKQREELRAKDAEAVKDAPAIEDGRYVVAGEVVGVKTVESDWGLTTKMMLKAPNGNKFWLTVPKALEDNIINERNIWLRDQDSPETSGRPEPAPLKGRQVAIMASWTVSKDDPHFAFGKRPVLK